MLKILWICGLPKQVQEDVLPGTNLGAHAAWSWVLGHLPPPPDVELHIACPCVKIRKRVEFEYKGATFHLVPCLPGRLQTGFLLDPLFFKPLVRALNPDVVHGWGTEDSFSIIAQSLAPDRCVVQVQGLINAYLPYLKRTNGIRYVAFRERHSLKTARHIFVESEYSRAITKEYCGPNTKKHVVDHPLRQDFLSATPVTGTAKAVLFVGSLCDRKGYLDAVQAFAETGNKDWILHLVGGGDETATLQLKNLIGSLPNMLRVEHIPSASSGKIVELMQQSSIFLLPSSMDTGPTALKEALAMGLWPVCYDNSGPREYISRFGYGSLAKTGDIAALALLLKTAMQARPWLEGQRLSSVVTNVRHDLCAATIWKELLVHYQDIAAQA